MNGSSFTRRDVLRTALLGAVGSSLSGYAQLKSNAGPFTYYVDNLGSDANSGLSPASPFQTIAKVNSLLLKPGQSVGFKAGGVWREALNVTTSGNSTTGPIQFGTYGTSSEPTAASWTQGRGALTHDDSTNALFVSGFETASLSDWNGGTSIGGGSPTLALSTNQPANGVTCLCFTGDGHDNRGAVCERISPMTAESTYYFRLYLRTPSGSLAPNNGLKYIQFFSPTAQLGYAELYTDSSGRISSLTVNMYSGGGYLQNLNLAGIYMMDQWNYLEIGYKIDPAAGSIQAWVNGENVANAESLNTIANAGLNQIQVGNGSYGAIVPKGSSIYFDDVKVATSGPIGAFPVQVPVTVWYTPQSANPLDVTFSGNPGTPVSGIGALTSFGQWYWDGSFLYVYSSTNPSNSVVVIARQYATITASGPAAWSQGSGQIGSEDGSGAVWYTPQTSNPLYPSFSGRPGTQVGSLSALTSPGQWYWDGSSLHVYSTGNPASSVEIPARPYAATLAAASYVSFSNLIFSGGQISGLFASGGCNSVMLNDCVLELNWENGGYFLDGSHYQNNGVIANCILRNNGASGWNTNGFFSSWLFENNAAYLNGQLLSGSIEHNFSAGIKMFSISGQDGTGTIVRGNRSYGNGPSSTYTGQGVGLWADTCAGVTFYNNVVYGNAGWGILLEKNNGSAAYLNVAFNNARLAFSANLASKVSDGNNASNNKIFNNTCYGGWWGIFCGAYEGSGQSTISNQLCANNIAYGAVNQNLWIDVGGDNDGSAGSGNVYTHNCLGPASINFIYWASAGFLNSYGQFDVCCGGTSASISGDPLFVNAATGNFQLRSGSLCLGAAVPVPNFTILNPNVGAL